MRRLAFSLGVGLVLVCGCRKAEVPTQLPASPSVRLYLVSNLAGALEPCGCRKDMLGGMDHAAALIAAGRAEAPQRLLLGAGPTFFQDPELDPARGDQDRWKAQALADSLADLQLGAWAPGVNDFAAGAGALGELAARSRAKPLAANLSGGPFASTATFEVGGYRVGVAGIGASPDAGAAADPSAALSSAAKALEAAGSQIRVALIAAARGDGMRLAERVPGFSLMLLGKAQESGDANDVPAPPTLVGDTLVVQASNHLQSVAYVDFFVQGNDFSFADGMGMALVERRQTLERRAQELERRLALWRAEQPPAEERISSAERDLAQLRGELRSLSEPAPPPAGSVFRYQLLEVRERAGSEPAVASRMVDYYRRVNDHNREAFKDRAPAPPAPGGSHYVGAAACESCHAEATSFWRTTQHARAYQTLATQFKEFNLDCVSCHVTGYNRPGGSTVTHVEALKDVQCESCHGPGSRHTESGKTELIRLKPEPTTCRGCHHEPHVASDWSLEQSWAKIIGPGHGAGSTPAAAKPAGPTTP